MKAQRPPITLQLEQSDQPVGDLKAFYAVLFKLAEAATAAQLAEAKVADPPRTDPRPSTRPADQES